MITCGHCGSRMTGKTESSKGGRPRRKVYYCASASRLGRGHCGYRSVGEDALAGHVLGALQRQFLNPENLAELREEIRRQDEEAMRPNGEGDRLRRRVAELEGQIRQATTNLAILPADRVPGVVAVLRGLEADRDRTAAELARLEGGAVRKDLEAQVAAAERQLWRLEEAAKAGDREALREALGGIVERVELHFGEVRQSLKRVRRPLLRGIIYLRQDGSALELTELSDLGTSGRRHRDGSASDRRDRRGTRTR
jgi:hypothetical protein